MSQESWYLSIEDALQGIADNAIDGDDFLRAIMAHPRWLVAGRNLPDGQQELGVIQVGDARLLEVFSDRDALARMERAHGQEFTGSIIEMPGYALFMGVQDAGITRVNINPGDERTNSYQTPEQIELLAAWAKQVRMELALLEPERVPEGLNILANYDEYHVVFEAIGAFSSIILAPDNEGRAMGAIFTSWKNAEAFCGIVQDPEDAPLQIMPIPASELFPLMQSLNLQALAFNPMSPIPARAVGIHILNVILPAIGHDHTHGRVSQVTSPQK